MQSMRLCYIVLITANAHAKHSLLCHNVLLVWLVAGLQVKHQLNPTQTLAAPLLTPHMGRREAREAHMQENQTYCRGSSLYQSCYRVCDCQHAQNCKNMSCFCAQCRTQMLQVLFRFIITRCEDKMQDRPNDCRHNMVDGAACVRCRKHCAKPSSTGGGEAKIASMQPRGTYKT